MVFKILHSVAVSVPQKCTFTNGSLVALAKSFHNGNFLNLKNFYTFCLEYNIFLPFITPDVTTLKHGQPPLYGSYAQFFSI